MGTQVLRPHDVLEGLVPRRKPSPRPHHRPAAPSKKQRDRSPKPAKGADGGKVPILKRGVAPKAAASPAPAEVYAGSAFSNSPAPSALPLPSFSLKKDAPAMGEYLATVALRRMLRLE